MENISPVCACPEKGTITILHLINLNLNDLTCTYSTLLHVTDLTSKENRPTASITFDQPLRVTAIEIVQTKKLKIIVRLWGFHCLMSFIGSTGMCMKGFDLEKMLVQMYSEKNVVSHIVSGKRQ